MKRYLIRGSKFTRGPPCRARQIEGRVLERPAEADQEERRHAVEENE